ncbi:MAG TPA: lipopolysaccharide kinase InaA family protein [Patescibacteria group bacterium]|nr:lipopolysaccharide kinase InaA family protein [Patescibacteria group bacterium]
MHAPIPPDLQTLIDATLPQMRARTKKFAWQDRSLWLKKSVPDKGTFWTAIQGFTARLVSLPMLRPTTNPGGATGLSIEISRTAAFRAAGFPAPAVIASSDSWYVMEDMGEMIDRKLQKDSSLDTAAQQALIERCATTLARLHQSGLAHGRAKLNDFVLTPTGEIGFIDFEEDVARSGMTLAELQARDVWLFCCSAARYDKPAVSAGFAAYRAGADDDVIDALGKFVRFAYRAAGFLGFARPLLKGDAGRAYDATMVLFFTLYRTE